MTDQSSTLPAIRPEIVPYRPSVLHEDDRALLQRAFTALEHQNLATRIAGLVGRQLGTLTKLMPSAVSAVVNKAAEKAIGAALTVAIGSLGNTAPRESRRMHKAAAAVSGAAGGIFGISSLPVELPMSTIIILRSIADIARQQGEDLSDPEVALACLEVFALGAHDKDESFTDSGYFAVRGLLAKTVSEAGRYVAAQGLGDAAAPVLVRFIGQIASRFGLVVSEKIAAQAVPLIGAAGGGIVNFAFADHFQSIAFGHFTVRRLERVYGGAVVRAEYDRIAAAA